MGLINKAVTGLFDLLFWPFQALSPVWGLVVISGLVGVLFLWIFGKTSNQEIIKVVRNRIRGHIIAIRLFGDDVGLLFRLQWRILRGTLTFLRHAMTPLLITLIPLVLVVIQLDLRFGNRPLEPGEHTLIKVRLSDPSALRNDVSLEVPDGVVIETPGVRAAELSEIAWRIKAERPGAYALSIKSGDETIDKEFLVGSDSGNPSKMRGGSFLEKLMHPAEPPIDSNSVHSVAITYPVKSLTAFGFGINWLITFLIASIAVGFACRGALGVEI